MELKRPGDLPLSNHYHGHDKAQLLKEYEYLWQRATIAKKWEPMAEIMVSRALKISDIYQRVGRARSLPWSVIAAIDMRESGCSPMGCLANGDPWDEITRHWPINKGPWRSKEESCLWALEEFEKGWNVRLAGIQWTIPEILLMAERWNGFGPRMEPGCIPANASPYIYSGAEFDGKPLYEKGKRKEHLVAGAMKGYFDANQVDEQLGVMAFLLHLQSKGFILTA